MEMITKRVHIDFGILVTAIVLVLPISAQAQKCSEDILQKKCDIALESAPGFSCARSTKLNAPKYVGYCCKYEYAWNGEREACEKYCVGDQFGICEDGKTCERNVGSSSKYDCGFWKKDLGEYCYYGSDCKVGLYCASILGSSSKIKICSKTFGTAPVCDSTHVGKRCNTFFISRDKYSCSLYNATDGWCVALQGAEKATCFTDITKYSGTQAPPATTTLGCDSGLYCFDGTTDMASPGSCAKPCKGSNLGFCLGSTKTCKSVSGQSDYQCGTFAQVGAACFSSSSTNDCDLGLKCQAESGSSNLICGGFNVAEGSKCVHNYDCSTSLFCNKGNCCRGSQRVNPKSGKCEDQCTGSQKGFCDDPSHKCLAVFDEKNYQCGTFDKSRKDNCAKDSNDCSAEHNLQCRLVDTLGYQCLCRTDGYVWDKENKKCVKMCQEQTLGHCDSGYSCQMENNAYTCKRATCDKEGLGKMCDIRVSESTGGYKCYVPIGSTIGTCLFTKAAADEPCFLDILNFDKSITNYGCNDGLSCKKIPGSPVKKCGHYKAAGENCVKDSTTDCDSGLKCQANDSGNFKCGLFKALDDVCIVGTPNACSPSLTCVGSTGATGAEGNCCPSDKPMNPTGKECVVKRITG